MALLAKWIWRYFSDSTPLWRNLVQEKYKYGPLFKAQDLLIPPHGGPWKSLCASLLSNSQSKALLKAKIWKKIGNRLDSFFWHDCWIGEQPIKNASVASFCFWGRAPMELGLWLDSSASRPWHIWTPTSSISPWTGVPIYKRQRWTHMDRPQKWNFLCQILPQRACKP